MTFGSDDVDVILEAGRLGDAQQFEPLRLGEGEFDEARLVDCRELRDDRGGIERAGAVVTVP
jgi:hypothetical protein